MQELSAQHCQVITAGKTVSKLEDAVHSFVRNPHVANSLIESLSAVADSKQHDAEAATTHNLAEAAQGHAVLRVQYDCQTTAATAAAFSTLLKKSGSQALQEQGEMNSTSGPKEPSEIRALDRDSLGSVASSGQLFCAPEDRGSDKPEATSEPFSDTGAHNLLINALDPAQTYVCMYGGVQFEVSTAVETLQVPEERALQGSLQRTPGRRRTQKSSHASSGILVSEAGNQRRAVANAPTRAGVVWPVAATQRQAHQKLQQKLAGIQPGTASSTNRPDLGRARAGMPQARDPAHSLPPAAKQPARVRSSRSQPVAATSGKGSNNGCKGPQVVPQPQSFLKQQFQTDGAAAALFDRLAGFTAMVRSRASSNAVSSTQLGVSRFGSRSGSPGGVLEPFENSLNGVTTADEAEFSFGQDRHVSEHE